MKDKDNRFKKIVSENSERIKRICGYYAPSAEDQKDMYQEILINVWNSLDKFRGEAALSTWIYRIAVNTSLSYSGKAYKRLKLNVNFDNQPISPVVDDDELSEKLKVESRLNLLQNELNQLSVIDKALISLNLEGLTMKEISQIIGITEPNAKVKIHRIKENLRNKLKGEHYEK